MPTVIGSSNGASSTASVTALAAQQKPGDVGAVAGDLMIIAASQERSGLPVINVSGLTQIRSENGGSDAVYLGWKRLSSTDLTSTISVSSDSNTSRRMMIGYVVLRNAKDPVAVSTDRISNGNGVLTATHPNITPTTNNTLLMSVAAIFSNVTPYIRTNASASGWTERVNAGSAQTTAINSYLHIATKQVNNGSGVSQTGNVVTDTAEKFVYYPSTLAVEHSAASAPVVIDLGSAQTVVPFTQVSISAQVSGGVGPTNRTWSQISGPTVTTTVSGASLNFLAPPGLASQVFTFRYSVLDDGSTITKDISINVLAHNLIVKRGGQVKFVERLRRRGSILVGTGRNVPVPGGAEDSTPPQLSISAPASGATVSGVVNLNGTVSDPDPDTTPPVLSITAPPADAVVSGTTSLSGLVSD